MDRFISEEIEMKYSGTAYRPVKFLWKDRTYEIEEVLERRLDVGFDSNPYRKRDWRSRHHRLYFRVRTAGGRCFELYLDYARKSQPRWILLKEISAGATQKLSGTNAAIFSKEKAE